ncbi:MAG: hypothetical protein KatS3mg029_0717 [Saprospiraceae bacterium]|nr:MAG: hypothetical protein KatS3mg029_0717 [Saprospiraceae bacterium]
MMKKDLYLRWILLTVIIVLVAAFRLLPYVADFHFLYNFSPIAAMALFGAAYFRSKWMAFGIPMLALWVSNLILDNVFLAEYYDGFVAVGNAEVYLSFLLVGVLGFLLLKKVTPMRVAGASLGASVLFFIVSNLFVWLQGTMYPLTWEGLVACYVAAIPFFWNTLAGDLFFCALMFGAFEALAYWKPSLKLAESQA